MDNVFLLIWNINGCRLSDNHAILISKYYDLDSWIFYNIWETHRVEKGYKYLKVGDACGSPSNMRDHSIQFKYQVLIRYIIININEKYMGLY